MQRNPTQKWSHPRRRPGHIPGYRPEKPFRFRDWAAF